MQNKKARYDTLVNFIYSCHIFITNSPQVKLLENVLCCYCQLPASSRCIAEKLICTCIPYHVITWITQKDIWFYFLQGHFFTFKIVFPIELENILARPHWLTWLRVKISTFFVCMEKAKCTTLFYFTLHDIRRKQANILWPSSLFVCLTVSFSHLVKR